MVRYALLVLFLATSVGAQEIGTAAPRPQAGNGSYGSIAFGWREGSVAPSYSLNQTNASVEAGTTILSLRLGTPIWELSAESSLSVGSLIDRHAGMLRRTLRTGRTSVSLGLAYGYLSENVPTFDYENLQVRAHREIHTAMGDLSASRELGRGVTVFGGSVFGFARVKDAFDTFLDGQAISERGVSSSGGSAGILGLRTGAIWRWYSFSVDGAIEPLWAVGASSSVITDDVIASAGIAYRTPWKVGFSVRMFHTISERSINHLGNTVTASITVAYP